MAVSDGTRPSDGLPVLSVASWMACLVCGHAGSRNLDRWRRKQAVVRLAAVEHESLEHKVGTLCLLKIMEPARWTADYLRDCRHERVVGGAAVDLWLVARGRVLLAGPIVSLDGYLRPGTLIDLKGIAVKLFDGGPRLIFARHGGTVVRPGPPVEPVAVKEKREGGPVRPNGQR